MNPKISIVMPIYNVEEYLKEALNSILNQSIDHRHLEVIMVNDNSSDKSGEIIDQYCNDYNNFKAIHLSENSGSPGKPRNIGIDASKGQYLMFFDPDDYYAPDACEILYDKISSKSADIVSTQFYFLFENYTTPCGTPLGDWEEVELKKIDDDENFFRLAPAIWSKIYNKKFIKNNKIRFIENDWAEDLEFNIHTLLHANKIIHLNNYFSYYYRVRNNENKSFTYTPSKENLIKTMNGYYATDSVLKRHKKEKFFTTIFSNHLERWIDKLVLSDINKKEKKEIIINASSLINKYLEFSSNLEPIYLPIFKDISEKRFDQVFLDINSLSHHLEICSDLQKQIDYLKIYSDKVNSKNNLLGNKLKECEKSVKLRKIQIAELQTLKGYLKYKTNNIYQRINETLG